MDPGAAAVHPGLGHGVRYGAVPHHPVLQRFSLPGRAAAEPGGLCRLVRAAHHWAGNGFILWAEADDAVCRCRRVYAFVRVVPEKSERPSGLYRRAGGSRRFVGHWFQRGCVRIAAVALGLCGGLFQSGPLCADGGGGRCRVVCLLVLPGPAAFGVTLHGVFLAGQILRRDLPGFFPFLFARTGPGGIDLSAQRPAVGGAPVSGGSHFLFLDFFLHCG